MPVIVCFAIVPDWARADDAPTMPPEARQAVIDRLDENKAAGQTFQLCPADAFDRQAPFWACWRIPRTLPEAQCTADPVGCYNQCVEHAVSGACFTLALSLRHEAFERHELYAEKLFSMGCAAGLGAACTNRAAGIRNALREGDPFHDRPEAERNSCQFRSFRIGCRQGDAWSCAMLGQSYQEGEGVERDPAAARESYDQSCAISPNFVACTFARGQLRTLDRP